MNRLDELIKKIKGTDSKKKVLIDKKSIGESYYLKMRKEQTDLLFSIYYEAKRDNKEVILDVRHPYKSTEEHEQRGGESELYIGFDEKDLIKYYSFSQTNMDFINKETSPDDPFCEFKDQYVTKRNELSETFLWIETNQLIAWFIASGIKCKVINARPGPMGTYEPYEQKYHLDQRQRY